MTSHTPGPWFVHDFADPAVSSAPGPKDVTVSCDHPATITVASMGRAMTATLEEARANARLIASAPDMLVALRCVAMVIGDLGCINRNGLTHQTVLNAISKAEKG